MTINNSNASFEAYPIVFELKLANNLVSLSSLKLYSQAIEFAGAWSVFQIA